MVQKHKKTQQSTKYPRKSNKEPPVAACTVNILYKSYQTPKLKCFLSRFAVVLAQFIEVRCLVENEDVVGAARTGHALTTSQW